MLIMGFLFIPLFFSAQSISNKSFYLIDSSFLEGISKYDKNLIDKQLNKYHEDKGKHDTIRLQHYIEIVQGVADLTLLAQYNEIFNTEVEQALKKHQDKKSFRSLSILKSHYLMNKAYGFRMQNQYDTVIAINQQAIAILSKVNYHKFSPNIYNNIARAYGDKGDRLKAIEYFNLGLNKAIELKDETTQALIYQNLATTHYDFKNYEKSMLYFDKSYNISKKYKRLTDITALGLNNQAKYYLEITKQYDIAKQKSKLGLDLLRNSNFEYYSVQCYLNLGRVYRLQDSLEKSSFYYDTALQISNKYNEKDNISRVYLGKAQLEQAKKNYTKAIEYATKCYDLEKKLNSLKGKQSITKLLKYLHYDINDYKSAYRYANLTNLYTDSLYDEKVNKALLQKTIEHEYKLQKEVDDLKNEQEINRIETEKRQSQYAFISAGIIGLIVLIASIILFNRLKVIRKQKRALDNAYELLEESKKNELAVSSLKALQSQMNPHFIFNALNSVQDLVLLQDIRKSNKYLGKFSDLIRKILLSSKKQFIPLSEEFDILQLYLDLEKLRFGDDFIVNLTTDVSIANQEKIEIPAMFIQPYIENAIKHGLFHKQGEKRLNVSFTVENNYLACIIEDNGVGQEKANELKQKNLHLHTGFSTEAINNRIRLLNQTLERKINLQTIDLEENGQPTGTKVVLQFPV